MYKSNLQRIKEVVIKGTKPKTIGPKVYKKEPESNSRMPHVEARQNEDSHVAKSAREAPEQLNQNSQVSRFQALRLRHDISMVTPPSSPSIDMQKLPKFTSNGLEDLVSH